MDLQNFIKKFSDAFEDIDSSQLKPDTEFKKLSEWDSMIALTLIAMIDDAYGVAIKGNDIKSAETIEDLFNIVSKK
jgi:acyl carrier protein